MMYPLSIGDLVQKTGPKDSPLYGDMILVMKHKQDEGRDEFDCVWIIGVATGLPCVLPTTLKSGAHCILFSKSEK